MMMRGVSRCQVRCASRRAFSSQLQDNTPVIVSFARTPVGSFQSSLSSLSAVQLGTAATKAAVERAGIAPEDVGEAFFGNVISAGLGQAPTRQVALNAGLPQSVPCTTVNKVCASGMKTVQFAAQAILTGYQDAVLAGGMESMSNIPYFLPKARNGYGFGHGQIVDGLLADGLTDAFDAHHMGACGDACASQFEFTREDQDAYAIESYKRSQAASNEGRFKDEIVAVEIPQRRGDPKVVDTDEEPFKVKFDKVPSLRPAFGKDGTVTAANASTLNDGASACIVTSAKFAREHGLSPLAAIRGFADAARAPLEFPIAPADAVPIALKNAGVTASDVDFYEINEAFSVVALANARLLDIDLDRLNVNGGGVSLGHPIGCSGNRIVGTLAHVLRQRDAQIGVAAICNGGGGASAVVIERL